MRVIAFLGLFRLYLWRLLEMGTRRLLAAQRFWERRAMSALLGYARISTTDQDASLQHDALAAAGCLRIFSDTASGARADRPELLRMLDYARADDTIVVWRLDRLGRSLRNLVELVNELSERHIDLRSLQENIDTTTPTGRLIFHVFGSLAEFERELIRERTKAGLASARARGRVGGRRALLTEAQVAIAKQLLASPDHRVEDVASTFKVSRSTLYRAIR